MLRKLFLDHPRRVDETYAEHFAAASSFGVTLLGASLACFAHACVPALCETTASRTIARLHARLSARTAHSAASASAATMPCDPSLVPAI